MALQENDVIMQANRVAEWPERRTENKFVTPEEKDSGELQYYLLYKSRLAKLKPILEDLTTQTWGSRYKQCARVLDAQAASRGGQDEVVIFGTLYKEMSKKRSVLEEYHDDAAEEAKIAWDSDYAIPGRFVSPEDHLLIEDEHGSIKVEGACLDASKLFTGIVAALRGKLCKVGGIFQVSELLLPGVAPMDPGAPLTPPIPSNSNNAANANNSSSSSSGSNNANDACEYIAFVSDLRFANIPVENCSSHLDTQLVLDYLCGFLGDAEEDQRQLTRRVSRLVVAGNVLGEDEMPAELDDMRYDREYIKKIDLAREKLDSKLKDLDLWLSQAAQTMHVDVMPGRIDPTNELLPQRGLHKCLFPLASQFDSFQCVSNPYFWILDSEEKDALEGREDSEDSEESEGDRKVFTMLGTSGENVDNMVEHGLVTEMECLELTLEARNLAPTAPDTLTCFPYRENDPFLMDSSPNIYFAGGRSKFDEKKVNGGNTLLLCVPSFVKTKQVVLVNKHTLECELMQFGHKF